MKASPRRFPLILAGWLASAAVVLAHPGHDDGHEVTWTFGHLVEHPIATLACLAVLSVAGWAGWQILRRQAQVRPQSFRGSQQSRGK